METGCNTYKTPTGVMLEQFKRNLGKVVMTTEGAHDRFKAYDPLCLVYDEDTLVAYISKKCVPVGVEITNRNYWQPMNVSGYSDDNVIIITDRNISGQLIPYTLEDVLPTVAEVSRKPGALLSFFSMNEGSHWELWQFNSDNNHDWENVNCWRSIYNTFNKFIGWYDTLDDLLKVYVGTYEGCYAIVGESIKDAAIYEGRADGWYKLDVNLYQKAFDDIIYLIGEEGISLTPEQKNTFKSFICGTDQDDCTDDCDGNTGPAGRVYTKFKVSTTLPESTFNLSVNYPEPPYVNEGHTSTFQSTELDSLEFDFISGTWFERKVNGVSIDAAKSLENGSCILTLTDTGSEGDLTSILIQVDKGKKYVYNSLANPYYNTITPTGSQSTVSGLFIPCDGKYHQVEFTQSPDPMVVDYALRIDGDIAVNVGKTIQLTAVLIDNVGGERSLSEDVTWTSADTSIATVTDGLITGIAAGDVIITADYSGYSATTAIAVAALDSEE